VLILPQPARVLLVHLSQSKSCPNKKVERERKVSLVVVVVVAKRPPGIYTHKHREVVYFFFRHLYTYQRGGGGRQIWSSINGWNLYNSMREYTDDRRECLGKLSSRTLHKSQVLVCFHPRQSSWCEVYMKASFEVNAILLLPIKESRFFSTLSPASILASLQESIVENMSWCSASGLVVTFIYSWLKCFYLPY